MSNEENEVVTSDTPTTRESSSRPWGMLLFLLVLIGFLAAFGYGYFQLAKVNMKLAGQVSNAEQQITALSKSVDNLAVQAPASAAPAPAQSNVAEVQYLVRLANDQIQYTHHLQQALTLLQRASQLLENSQDAGLIEIRKSLTTDIANLEAAPKVDVNDIYVHLVALSAAVTQLPLPPAPLSPDTTAANPTIDANLSWWKAGLLRSWQAIKQIVIVRNMGSKALPLVALPEEKIFLYQNLQAQLETAIWAVLHGNNTIYKQSLTRSMSWVQDYFAQDATETKTMLESLQTLEKIDVQPANIDISNTMRLLDAYKIG